MGPNRRIPFVHFHVRGLGGWLLKTVGGRLEADEALALGLELVEAAIVAKERARKENESVVG